MVYYTKPEKAPAVMGQVSSPYLEHLWEQEQDQLIIDSGENDKPAIDPADIVDPLTNLGMTIIGAVSRKGAQERELEYKTRLAQMAARPTFLPGVNQGQLSALMVPGVILGGAFLIKKATTKKRKK